MGAAQWAGVRRPATGRSTAIGRPGTATWLAIAAAWAGILALDATGNAARLHHHALIESATPAVQAIVLFLVGWELMLAAMMLPASLPAVRSADTVLARVRRPVVGAAATIIGFVAVWTAFGLAAFAGDAVLHRIVDATPALAANPWLIEAGLLGLAGAWQFAPLKRRSLDACRHPVAEPETAVGDLRGPIAFGIDQGIACLGSSWALMLLMFGEGVASLPWMIGLTVVMVGEAIDRRGPRLGRLVGIALIVAALATLNGAAV